MSRIENLSALVLKFDRKLQSENEKLIGLVAMQARANAEQIELMPKLKEQALAEFSQWAEGAKAELTDVAAYNAKSAVGKLERDLAEKNAAQIGEMTAKISATLEAARRAVLSGISKETDLSVRKYLASAEGVEKVRSAIEENAGPMLAALEAGSAFIDLYRGTFKPGTSKAKRGELWTYYGNTVLCTADTNREPVAFGNSDKLKNWVIVAASGAPGAVSTGSGGGSFSGQTGSLDLGSGDDTGTVTFSSAFSSAPVVTASILMPDADGAVISVGIHTVTTTGFLFALSGPTPDANHKLKYIAI